MEWSEQSPRSRFFYLSRAHQAAQFDAAMKHVGDLSGLSVLDYGCGYGDLIPRLPPDCDYLGVDVDADAVATARQLWPAYRFKRTSRVTDADVIVAVATLQCSDSPGVVMEQIADCAKRVAIATIWKGWCPEDDVDEEHLRRAWLLDRWPGSEFHLNDDLDFFTLVLRKD